MRSQNKVCFITRMHCTLFRRTVNLKYPWCRRRWAKKLITWHMTCAVIIFYWYYVRSWLGSKNVMYYTHNRNGCKHIFILPPTIWPGPPSGYVTTRRATWPFPGRIRWLSFNCYTWKTTTVLLRRNQNEALTKQWRPDDGITNNNIILFTYLFFIFILN